MTTKSRHEANSALREVINLRAPADQKAIIDRAAAVVGKSRTEFMLESARRAAVDVLLDQRLFVLNDTDYDRFLAILDEPTEPSAALEKLMNTPAPWEP